MYIPDFMLKFIVKRVKNSEACRSCNASCCTGPGFALLENVLKIFDRYKAGNIVREDYDFEKSLDLFNFIYKFFDRVVFNKRLIVFFPKVRGGNGNLVSVPPWNYYQARPYIHSRVDNKGCIFLNKDFYVGDNTGHSCILHDSTKSGLIYEKPIDCVFLNCAEKRNIVAPTEEESGLWFALIDYYFPKSSERFKQMFPGRPD